MTVGRKQISLLVMATQLREFDGQAISSSVEMRVGVRWRLGTSYGTP